MRRTISKPFLQTIYCCICSSLFGMQEIPKRDLILCCVNDIRICQNCLAMINKHYIARTKTPDCQVIDCERCGRQMTVEILASKWMTCLKNRERLEELRREMEEMSAWAPPHQQGNSGIYQGGAMVNQMGHSMYNSCYIPSQLPYNIPQPYVHQQSYELPPQQYNQPQPYSVPQAYLPPQPIQQRPQTSYQPNIPQPNIYNYPEANQPYIQPQPQQQSQPLPLNPNNFFRNQPKATLNLDQIQTQIQQFSIEQASSQQQQRPNPPNQNPNIANHVNPYQVDQRNRLTSQNLYQSAEVSNRYNLTTSSRASPRFGQSGRYFEERGLQSQQHLEVRSKSVNERTRFAGFRSQQFDMKEPSFGGRNKQNSEEPVQDK